MKPFYQYIIHPNFLFNKKVLELFCTSAQTLHHYRFTSPNYDFYAIIYEPDKAKLVEIATEVTRQINAMSTQGHLANAQSLPSINYILLNDINKIADHKELSDIDIIYSHSLTRYIESKEKLDQLIDMIIPLVSKHNVVMYFMDIDNMIIPQTHFFSLISRKDIVTTNIEFFSSIKNVTKKKVDLDKVINISKTDAIDSIIDDPTNLQYYDVGIFFTKDING